MADMAELAALPQLPGVPVALISWHGQRHAESRDHWALWLGYAGLSGAFSRGPTESPLTFGVGKLIHFTQPRGLPLMVEIVVNFSIRGTETSREAIVLGILPSVPVADRQSLIHAEAHQAALHQHGVYTAIDVRKLAALQLDKQIDEFEAVACAMAEPDVLSAYALLHTESLLARLPDCQTWLRRYLRRLTQDASPAVRQVGAWGLATMPPETWPTLSQMLADKTARSLDIDVAGLHARTAATRAVSEAAAHARVADDRAHGRRLLGLGL